MSALETILQRHPVWRGGSLAKNVAALPTGFPCLDAELPGGGWPRQGLTELLTDEVGIGELELVLPALAALTSAGNRSVWIGPPHVPYAPALAAAGLDLTHLLIVTPASSRDALWAAEQALRSGGCHALAAWLRKPRYAELQRLAVAAEASHAVAFLFRPLAPAAAASPAGSHPCRSKSCRSAFSGPMRRSAPALASRRSASSYACRATGSRSAAGSR